MKKLISITLAVLMLAVSAVVFPAIGIADGEALELSHEWDSLDMGETHSAAIQPVGQAYAWGYNYDGPIGNGSATGTCPTPYHYADNIRAVSVERKTTLSIDNNDVLYIQGEIWWGIGGSGDMPIPYVYTAPHQFDTNVKQAVMGYNHLIYVKNDGTVWVYGENGHGQLGDNTTTNSYTPKQVSSLTGVTYVAAGNGVSFALKEDGSLWGWGNNTDGTVGNNSTTDRKTPVQVLTNVFSVSVMNDHVLALKNDGTVWAWGNNEYGKLGRGNTTTPQKSPVQVMTGAAQVSAGMYHSAVLKTDGTLWFAGNNYRGCFGSGDPGSYSGANPSFIQTAGTYLAVKCGVYCTAVVGENGQVSVAGANGYGQLGTGSTAGSVPAFTPIDVWIFNDEPQPGWLIGDSNVNGTVEFADVTALIAHLLNVMSLTPQGAINADANQDGLVNILDAAAIYTIAMAH